VGAGARPLTPVKPPPSRPAYSARMVPPPARVLIVQGHPEPGTSHLCHALADAYAAGARSAGHAVRQIRVADLDFPLLRSPGEWERGAVPAALAPAQEDIRWATHLVLVYPLWLGGMPALLKGFLEQVARPGFAFRYDATSALGTRRGLGGRSARVVVTMGMPALAYRWFYRAHSLKALKRNILGFVGFAPVRDTVVGGVGRFGARDVTRWQARLRALGERAR